MANFASGRTNLDVSDAVALRIETPPTAVASTRDGLIIAAAYSRSQTENGDSSGLESTSKARGWSRVPPSSESTPWIDIFHGQRIGRISSPVNRLSATYPLQGLSVDGSDDAGNAAQPVLAMAFGQCNGHTLLCSASKSGVMVWARPAQGSQDWLGPFCVCEEVGVKEAIAFLEGQESTAGGMGIDGTFA